MNYNLKPENEFELMQEFFLSGGTVDNMPAELFRVRKIWLRADQLLRQFPYYNNEKIANHLIADLPEFNLALSTAKRHVTLAKRYFNEVEKETPATHRRILTELCYKQIAILEQQQLEYPKNAHNISKQIEKWSNRLAALNKLYEPEKADDNTHGDITIILSSNELDFPDIPQISDKELYTIIDEVAEEIEITTKDKQKIIDKDVKGKII